VAEIGHAAKIPTTTDTLRLGGLFRYACVEIPISMLLNFQDVEL